LSTPTQPKVYLDYTQAELDAAYDQRVYAPNREEIVAWYGAEGERVRARLPHRRSVPYGEGEDETLDIFQPKMGSESNFLSPIHVHIHGGRWTLFTKDEESFIAPTFVGAGTMYAVPDFSNIPKVRIPQMVGQVRRAIAWIHKNAENFGGDPERIHLSAHSSGSHLAGVALLTDWQKDFGVPADVIKSALLISGMYDLRPVMLSARSSYVKLSDDEVRDLSAILQPEKLKTPVTLVYGEKETPEFRRQPKAYAEVLKAAGKSVTVVEVPGVNHFEVLRQLGEPGSAVAQLALRMMSLPSR
jgi:arylformamidase